LIPLLTDENAETWPASLTQDLVKTLRTFRPCGGKPAKEAYKILKWMFKHKLVDTTEALKLSCNCGLERFYPELLNRSDLVFDRSLLLQAIDGNASNCG